MKIVQGLSAEQMNDLMINGFLLELSNGRRRPGVGLVFIFLPARIIHRRLHGHDICVGASTQEFRWDSLIFGVTATRGGKITKGLATKFEDGLF
ncbi:hypothetical protein A8144_09615 [Mycobacterium leprae 3125609]|nr:hypothetical protein A8144_09615 [Mycobacterium leprae 3125609]OAX70877.1 hypothetical protein A3216_09160 [Mycobacterium leprae 7935681]